jgi:hypothetical protein
VSVAFEVMVLLLVVVPALPALLVIILVHHHAWRSGSPSLRERALLAFRDWIVASMAATMALNRLFGWGLPNETIILLLTLALLLVSLPSAFWLWMYWRGAFR